MSNTSLKPITIPKLNTPDFGKSIMEAFENISLNFQKLSNLGVNKGAPGRSCVYIPINLGAAFVYNPYTTNDRDYAIYYNMSERWLNKVNREMSNNDKWKEYVATVNRDLAQFANATGYDEHEYARIACMLIWGNPFMFGFNSNGDRVVASPSSLAGALHTKYKLVEGSAHVENSEGPVLYGNWLYELNTLANTIDVVDRYFDIFLTHWDISPVGKLIVAFSPDSEYNTLQPVGSFEYWYIDPRYRCGKEVIGDSAIRDISCVLRWESDDFTPGPETRWGGSFEILEIFPSIQVGKDGKYYWFINGLSTGIPVQGNPGKDGSAGRFVIVERVENVTGWHPTEYPNGQNYASPKYGRQVITIPTLSGVPSRVLTSYRKRLADNIQIRSNVPLASVDETFTTDYDLAESATGRISQFVHTETNAWLPATYNAQLENISNIAYLHRIFRIIGREKFWKYPTDQEVKVDPIDDEWDRMGDPSCDYFYFGKDGVSTINDSQAAQDLMKELDGAAAIVLPGPAYQHDRTDTSFWFATLRLVKVADDNYMLVAYCTPHAQQTTQLDEHSQLGMMMGFDAYAYKSVSDNRNKPRGLVLPIGSIAVASETPSDTWAAHIIHSDAGGFDGRYGSGDDCRGKQHTPDDNRVYDSDMPLMPDNGAGAISTSPLTQFSHLIKKRILHVGSVDDVRTLNYIENSTSNGAINGAVPGRRPRSNELGPISPVGSSNFFGQREGNWFVGAELHVDEPVTITRYRDLKPKGRLLDVEGDVVIGPHQHKNIPSFRYRNNAGGLWVASTLSSETLDSMLYDESIFPKTLVNGKTYIAFEPFIADSGKLTSGNESSIDSVRWNTILGRWNGTRSIYTDSPSNDLNRDKIEAGNKPLFSALFDDAIGARMVIVEDGIAVYNPAANLGERNNIRTPFSVDAMGNIQTYGREIRSNSFDTRWCFHTKWADGYKPSMLRPDNNEQFGLPGHNDMIFATDHEVQWADNADDFNQRFWRSANLMPIVKDGNGRIMSDNATRLPLGYYGTIGFMDSTGRSLTTFPFKSGIAANWGDSDYLPTILSLPNDMTWHWGGQMTTGINPLPFRREFDGNPYGMRFGGTFNYGVVILNDARKPATPPSNTTRNVTADIYKSDSLSIKYKWDDFADTIIPEGVTDERDIAQYFSRDNYDFKDTTGELAKLFRTAGVTSGIGLWNMSGQVVEKSMIVGGDILGYSSALVRGQIRGRSFRRLINSENESRALVDGIQPKWAFLLDNGFSSETARQAALISDKIVVSSEVSPIYMDFGPYLGDKRLVKFGYINSKLTSAGGKLAIRDDESANDSNDRQLALVASTPWESFATTRVGYLFKQSLSTKYPITATLTSVGGVNKLDIKLTLNHRIRGLDSYRHTGSQRHRFNVCYGIDAGNAPKDNTTSVTFTDLEKEGGPRATYEGKEGKTHWNNKGIKVAPEEQVYDKTKNAVCNGFNALGIFNDHPECKPKTAQWFALPSLYAGSEHCNWRVNGSNDDRSFQKGLWFMLDTDGNLYIPYWSEPGSLFNSEMTINISFTWMSAGISNTRYNFRASKRKLHDTTGKVDSDKINQATDLAEKNDLIEPVWNDWSNGGQFGWLYIQYIDGGIESDWILFDTNSQTTTEHLWFTAWDSDNDKPTDSAENNPIVARFDDAGNVLPPSNNSYRYLALVNTTVKGPTNPRTAETKTDVTYTLLLGPEGADINGSDGVSDWTWTNLADPTNAILINWLNNNRLASLTDSIVSMMADDEDNETSNEDDSVLTINAPYGQATIEKTTLANGKTGAKVSLWVTAESNFGKTHRSINFTVTEVNGANSKIISVDALNSVLLKKQITPGYYKSTKIDSGKPAGDVTYLGATQTETTNGSNYIWYTSDGDAWNCVSAPANTKNDRVYVLCTSRSIYLESKENGAKSYYVPAGIVGYFDVDNNIHVLKGKDFYIQPIYNETVDKINDSTELGRVNTAILQAADGKLNLAEGFTYVLSIKRSDIGNNACWQLEYLAGMTPLWNLTKISRQRDFNSAREHFECRWVNKTTGDYVGSEMTASFCDKDIFTNNGTEIDSAKFADGRFERWISLTFTHYLAGSSTGNQAVERKYAVYSDNTGWSGQYEQCVIENRGALSNVDMRSEVTMRAPQEDSGPFAVTQLSADFNARIQSSGVLIEGSFHVIFGSMNWPTTKNESGTEAPNNNCYLCGWWSLGKNNWPSGLYNINNDGSRNLTPAKALCMPYCIIDNSSFMLTRFVKGSMPVRYMISYKSGKTPTITKLTN